MCFCIALPWASGSCSKVVAAAAAAAAAAARVVVVCGGLRLCVYTAFLFVFGGGEGPHVRVFVED